MGFVLESSWTEIFLFVTTFILLVTNYFYNSYKYWAKKRVPFIQPRFPLGNTNTLLPRGLSVGTLSKKFYDELKKRGKKFGGVYLVTEPNLVVVDPEYIKDILCKDFHHFVDRGFYYNKKDDPISAHLFSVDGTDWKNLRVKLTPTFTSGKMKMMFQNIVECCGYMKEAIDKSLGEDLEIKEYLGRFTTDVIGSCAFGIECNSFKYPDAEFRIMGKRHFEYYFWRSIKSFFMMNLPRLSLQLGLCPVRKDLRVFFRRIVAETVKMRETNQIRRNDFLQLLIDMKNLNDFTIDDIVAQVFLFFIAGFENSSSTMTFALYELARNLEMQQKLRTGRQFSVCGCCSTKPDYSIQQMKTPLQEPIYEEYLHVHPKLRSEVNEVLENHEGQITYESLSEMKYLGQVLDETLRMYPPVVTLNRRCTKNYTLRNTDIVLEKGTPVLISTLGLHTDPEHYPEPEKFDPERFSDENRKTRHPLAYLPFGDGPRNCIGVRFGLMQSKVGIVTVIKNFSLSVSPITKPVEFDPYSFVLFSTTKIYLRAEKL